MAPNGLDSSRAGHATMFLLEHGPATVLCELLVQADEHAEGGLLEELWPHDQRERIEILDTLGRHLPDKKDGQGVPEGRHPARRAKWNVAVATKPDGLVGMVNRRDGAAGTEGPLGCGTPLGVNQLVLRRSSWVTSTRHQRLPRRHCFPPGMRCMPFDRRDICDRH